MSCAEDKGIVLPFYHITKFANILPEDIPLLEWKLSSAILK
jgi:hypothetical protein